MTTRKIVRLSDDYAFHIPSMNFTGFVPTPPGTFVICGTVDLVRVAKIGRPVEVSRGAAYAIAYGGPLVLIGDEIPLNAPKSADAYDVTHSEAKAQFYRIKKILGEISIDDVIKNFGPYNPNSLEDEEKYEERKRAILMRRIKIYSPGME